MGAYNKALQSGFFFFFSKVSRKVKNHKNPGRNVNFPATIQQSQSFAKNFRKLAKKSWFLYRDPLLYIPGSGVIMKLRMNHSGEIKSSI